MAKTLRITALILISCCSTANSGDWNQFRGPAATGVSAETGLPLEWSADRNIVWKAELPGPGNSSPIVSRGKVFVSCATDKGKRRSLFCFDRKTGEQLWEKTVLFDGDEPTHRTNPYGGSSPAADGERVVVWHSSAGLHCYDYSGKELWARDLGSFRHIWGYGGSPIIHDGKVLLNCGPGKRTFLTAIDITTGKTLWEAEEPPGTTGEEGKSTPELPLWLGSWSTPIVIRVDEQEQVLMSYARSVKAYDLTDGKVLWHVNGLGHLVYSSPLVGDGMGVVMGGYHGPAIGFRLGGKGDMTDKNLLWKSDGKNPQRIGSGVIIGDYVYLANARPATAQCLELKTGKTVWQSRLPEGEIWGSVLAAQNRLYVSNPEGKTYVFAATPDEFQLLATNELGESTHSTPAFSDGQIFLRTFQHIWCIGSNP